jgi:hypothetical protein
MLASRADVFAGDTQELFEAAFSTSFEIDDVAPSQDSVRTLYLMRPRRR